MKMLNRNYSVDFLLAESKLRLFTLVIPYKGLLWFSEQEISKVRWYDTSHERIMTASETRHKDDFFAFKRVDQEGGGAYYFTPMDLEIYNNKVKQHLAAGSNFTNNEDLIKAFLATTEDEV